MHLPPNTELHQMLEGSWGVTQPKRHSLELVEAHRGGKGSLLLFLWVDLNLPVAAC